MISVGDRYVFTSVKCDNDGARSGGGLKRLTNELVVSDTFYIAELCDRQ